MDRLSTKQQSLVIAALPSLGVILLIVGIASGAGVAGFALLAVAACAVGAWLAATRSDSSAEIETLKAEHTASMAVAKNAQALNVCQACVMLADEDLNIVYVNQSAEKMLKGREQQIREALPTFNSSQLVGTNVDVFHKNPSHQRSMIQSLSSVYETSIEVNGLTFGLIATPWDDGNGNRQGTIIEWEDKTDRLAAEQREKELADSNARISSALKVCQANVMMADADLNIVYMNDSIGEMLGQRERELKQVLPNFSVANLMGTCVDDFHKNPEHQRGLLKDLATVYETDLELNGMTFGLIATPVFSDAGERVGTVVEWEDKTERLAEEHRQKELADSNARISSALKVCQANVMMADADLNIVYMNDSIGEMLSRRETEIKAVLPNFNSCSLMGTCVDDFHKNPAHQREMLKDLKQVYETKLELNGLTFGLIATPVFDEEGGRVGTVVEWEDKTDAVAAAKEEKRIAAENERVKQALDNVGTATMIADTDFNVIYMNRSATSVMRNAEADIRKDIPSFDASKLLGTNIDIFHKNPSHQRNMVNNLSGTFKSELNIGGRTMTIVANSVEVDGERLGTVVEWVDRTDEVAIEQEINHLVNAANQGDFTIQLPTDGKQDFFLNLTNGLNSLTDTANTGLTDVLRVINSMSGGDLTNKIEANYDGIFGSLKDGANSTIEKLKEVITEIRAASVTLSSGAAEIATGNADLSKRTEEQASSLEETASSMEEMTSVVKQGAENSKNANDLAQTAKAKANEGGVVVQRAINAMEEINTSSKEIADIIGVIEEIAFQTNLLALNAAVEAARAGEQGRGFAVVAGEVRNLAQRSADASKEIKDLIRNSETKVSEGSNLVNESGKTLADIEEAVVKVSSMIADISSGAEEQTSGIEQVNTAVAQMDEMTQQNAALVEQASASSEAVSDRAVGLAKMMDFFNTGESHSVTESSPSMTASAPRSAPAPAASDDDDDWQEF